MKHGVPSVPSWTEWLTTPAHSSSALPRGARIGLDPALIAVADYTTLAPALASAGVELVPVRDNLVDVVWDVEARDESGGEHGKPARPKEDVFVLGDEHAGEGARSKIARVRAELDKQDVFGGDAKAKTGDKRCWGLVVTQLDEIACALASFPNPLLLGRSLTSSSSSQGSSTCAAPTFRTTPSSSPTSSSRPQRPRARPSSSTSTRSRRRRTTTSPSSTFSSSRTTITSTSSRASARSSRSRCVLPCSTSGCTTTSRRPVVVSRTTASTLTPFPRLLPGATGPRRPPLAHQPLVRPRPHPRSLRHVDPRAHLVAQGRQERDRGARFPRLPRARRRRPRAVLCLARERARAGSGRPEGV